MTTNEGGSIAEEVYVRNVVDRVDTFGTVFLGLTVGCTRCHDHKYDTLTMGDYYSLFAFFNSLDGKAMDDNRKDPPPVLRAPTSEQRRQMAELDLRMEELQAKLQGDMPDVDRQQQAWEREFAALVSAQTETGSDDAGAESNVRNANMLVMSDWHSVGPFGAPVRYLRNRKHGPEGSPIDLKATFKLATGDEVGWRRRPEWVDGKVHNDLSGEPAANLLYRSIQTAVAQQVEASLGSDDGIKVYLNGKEILKNFVARGAAPDQEKITLELQPGVNHLLLKIINISGQSGFYFAVASDQPVAPSDLVEVVQTPINLRTAEQRKAMRTYFRNKLAQSDKLEKLQDELAASREQRAAVDRAVGATLIWREMAEPRPAFMLLRGQYDQRGDRVERQTPAALPPMASELPRNRLGLAQWLLAPENPLVARVAVNRFWQQVFGVGLVETSDDFGSQGTPPSHP
ncbi:MAG: DUF1553 domain-containing protein, partial [Planctomycetota bacterium]